MESNQNGNEPSEWSSPSEIGEKYNLSASTVKRWVFEGTRNIRYFKDGRTIRIHTHDFDDYIKSLVTTGVAETDGE